MSNDRVDIEALRGLVAKATPTPWEKQPYLDIAGESGFAIIGLRLGDDGEPIWAPTNGLVAYSCQSPTEIDDGDLSRAEANADLLVAAVNTLPALLDELAALREREAALVGALREMIRLADMGLEQALAEPEENGCYVAYTAARRLLETTHAAG